MAFLVLSLALLLIAFVLFLSVAVR